MSYKIIELDPYLTPYEKDIRLRMEAYHKKKRELLKDGESLSDFANGADYFGIHKVRGGWVYREWAPAADNLYFIGDFNNWDRRSHPMERLDNGVFEIRLEGSTALRHGGKCKVIVCNRGREMERIPSYAHRVVQDPTTHLWSAEIWNPARKYKWQNEKVRVPRTPLIYECHVGMAQEEPRVGTYKEFTKNILPWIKKAGYNTIQMMAIMEHPYYASFGYQVCNFFAASSRFGTPDDLKELIDTAHGMGIIVFLDVVHSHAAKNTNEGLAEFDGTRYQYFHEGGRGIHTGWDTLLFDYGKNEVLHFLLSNLKYWMTEYRFDGFRFDGVTSMLYLDHGMEKAFTHYDAYFSENTDIESIVYLMLANELVHSLNSKAVTIAEDMSGMPGMCLKLKDGGIGFDYRLNMGMPDKWIKLLKEVPDENWDLWNLWYELTTRRPGEREVGYVESHDQALVGDKTVMFRLCDQEMYWNMSRDIESAVIDRGIALHKMIRLITFSLAGEAYLNFMGNEFGHPQWIDFPREGNGWSYEFCRRQWSLVDDPNLKYGWLGHFDREMLAKLGKIKVLGSPNMYNLWVNQEDMLIAYQRGDSVFVFNFHPSESFYGYFIPVVEPGRYRVVLTTDDPAFGGYGRTDKSVIYQTEEMDAGQHGFLFYTPSRTGVVLERL